MISAVRSNQSSFKEVSFGPGFNVVLADRTKESTQTDSRNGLGKTTLIEIIHFCLGATATSNRGLMVPQLREWSFTLDMKIRGRDLSVTRSTSEPRWFHLDGDVDGLGISTGRMNRLHAMDLKSWTSTLGRLLFGLDGQEQGYNYRPTFRNLISYFARRGGEGFVNPFAHIVQQPGKNRQVSNAFLLGLSWEHASRLNDLQDERTDLNLLRRAARSGRLAGISGTIGNLESERARLDSQRRESAQRLDAFRVHPDYAELEEEANSLTSLCHRLANENQSDSRLLDLYQETLESEQEPDMDDLLEMYQEVGRAMPNLVVHRLEEVREFHRQLVANRREYLQDEIRRIEVNIERRDREIQAADEQRARLLETLSTHGALSEHVRLRERHLDIVNELRELDYRIENLRRFEHGQSEVRVKRELLLQDVRREFQERRDVRDQAIKLFNANSQALYSAPGDLILEVTDSGFRFDVDISRSGSQGINKMKIFCYDLTLAQLWSTRRPSPRILVHDSTIFDGVDERQIARALELAQKESEDRGFQYVCALNSDAVPSDDFSSEFDLDPFIRLRLTDESVEGSLLGIRY